MPKRVRLASYQWGGGGVQGGLNLLLPVPFNPGSRPVFFGSRPFAIFRLRNIAQCCVIFLFFSRFPPPWESRFPPPLLPPPVHLQPPFLPVSRPHVPPPLIRIFDFLSLSTDSRYLQSEPLNIAGVAYVMWKSKNRGLPEKSGSYIVVAYIFFDFRSTNSDGVCSGRTSFEPLQKAPS